jgi:hypothetical protein
VYSSACQQLGAWLILAVPTRQAGRCTPGALLYVIGEILPVGRRLTWEVTLLGLMAGFLLALATKLVLRSPAADHKTRALLTPPAAEPNSLPGGHRSNPFVGMESSFTILRVRTTREGAGTGPRRFYILLSGGCLWDQVRSRSASTMASLMSGCLVAVSSVRGRSFASSRRCCSAAARWGCSSSAR